MANPTTNYGFVLPTPTDLVTDLPADFDVALQGVDTQMLTNENAATAKATLTTKGDIYVATAASTISRLAVGATNGMLLTVDSSQATGLKYATPAAAGSTLLASATGTSGSNYSTTSTSFVDIDATRFFLTFTAPASGAIVIRTSIAMEFNGGGNTFYNYRESTTNLTGTDFICVNNGSAFPKSGTFVFNAYVSGITAGSHTYKLGFKSTSGNTFFGYTNTTQYLLEAWSA